MFPNVKKQGSCRLSGCKENRAFEKCRSTGLRACIEGGGGGGGYLHWELYSGFLIDTFYVLAV